ncbi:MAG: type I methionyl aminopeptidase [Actinomycetota bacterium]|nr:type I methionyl aminopeptidase [Actinomycetota bacterium]MDD5666408.1 type I methionyl aminopeptidase [Actinomycetota bacterium]
MIIRKSREEIAKMREAGRIVAGVLDMLEGHIRPGVKTETLNELAEEYIRERNGIPSFLGYRGFPASICTSINEVVVHGIPDRTRLREGDIIGVDVGVVLEGYQGDAARTYAVGEVSESARRLMDATAESLRAGIEACRPGKRLGDISNAIQRTVENEGFSVVVQFVGHGIGKEMHEEPQIPNFGPAGRGSLLEEGMTFALEPMVNEGTYEVEVDEGDGWTVRTADGRLSAHFEHTVAITAEGPYVLTLP